MPEPGKPLKEEERDEIIEAYAEHESLTAVDEEVDYSMNSIQKYVNKALEEGDPRLEHCEDWEPPEEEKGEWTGDGPTPSPVDPNAPDDVANYAGMSPGDFLHDFFDDFEVGLKQRWVEIMARRADRRGSLPSKDSLKGDILGMKSGIGQSNYQEASYIAEEYWAAAQQYIRQTGIPAGGQAAAAQQQGYNPHATSPPGQQQPMGGVGGQQPGVGTQPPAGGQQGEIMQAVMGQLQRMQQKIDRLESQDNGQSETKSMVERLREFQEQKQIFEELSGGDEYVQRLEQQINNLQQQMAQTDDPGRTPAPQQGESMEEKLFMMAATSEAVDMEDVMEALDRMEGTNKPVEVLEVEKEAEIEEKKLEHEQQKQERYGDLIETFADRIGQQIGEAMTSGGAPEEMGGDKQQSSAASTQPAATRTESPAAADGGSTTQQPAAAATAGQAQVETKPCPECDGTMIRGPNNAICRDCQYGLAPCDVCKNPLEIPPSGQANFGRCAECTTIIEIDDPAADTIECPDCEWEGGYGDLRGELVECDGCGEHRPIQRVEDLEQQTAAVEDFFDGD